MASPFPDVARVRRQGVLNYCLLYSTVLPAYTGLGYTGTPLIPADLSSPDSKGNFQCNIPRLYRQLLAYTGTFQKIS